MAFKSAIRDLIQRAQVAALYILLRLIPRRLGRGLIARIRYALILLGEDLPEWQK